MYFQKKASAGIDSYFLGSNKIPWWALGASGMASNLDVSGTMINVAMIYALGASGFFIELRGGIVLIMAFFMIFMGKWNRRSNVMTLAEWMKLRFGEGTEGNIARIITAVANIVITIAIVTYFAYGAGKFIGEFLGFPEWLGLPQEFWASVLMIGLAMIYTVASGLHGVVWTDVFQGVLIFATIVVICFISMVEFGLPESFSISMPLLDGGFETISTTKDAWTSVLPNWELGLPENSAYSIYNLFGIAIIFYLIKTVIEGSGGTGGYMVQRFFAARSDREAGLLSLFWTFLLSFRWPFIAAIAIMGVSYGVTSGNVISDPERVLPIVIYELVPIGLKGLLVAGLMAAAMSTFDSLVNSGAAYWVKDIYQAFIKPDATEKQLVKQSRWSSVIMVAIGLAMTLNITSINDIWGWLTMGLGSGLIVPLLVRWYWWRLNGYGFAAGVAGGMLTAIVYKLLVPNSPEYFTFLAVVLMSFIALVAGTLVTSKTKDEILENFYSITRPFGFWKPVKDKLDKGKVAEIKKENRRDIASIAMAVPWQIVLFLTGMSFILKNWNAFFVLLVVLFGLSLGLYNTWFKHLSKDNSSLPTD